MTENEMNQRRRMLELRERITDIILETKVTRSELIGALVDLVSTWNRFSLREELEETPDA